jgi:serine/threonine protein kinase
VPFHGPNPLAVINDRLINHPTPPRELDPAISPQLQEIIYRALERNPANRYASAGEFARDLRDPAAVDVADRDELQDWKSRRSSQPRTILKYVMFAMIPLIIFILLLITAKHN